MHTLHSVHAKRRKLGNCICTLRYDLRPKTYSCYRIHATKPMPLVALQLQQPKPFFRPQVSSPKSSKLIPKLPWKRKLSNFNNLTSESKNNTAYKSYTTPFPPPIIVHAPTAEPPAASEHAQLGLREELALLHAKVILVALQRNCPNQTMEMIYRNDSPKQSTWIDAVLQPKIQEPLGKWLAIHVALGVRGRADVAADVADKSSYSLYRWPSKCRAVVKGRKNSNTPNHNLLKN